MSTFYLELEDAFRVIERLGFHVRDTGLLSSALARPRSAFAGVESYPDLAAKAAALLESLARNHPLFDGNKRTAWVLTQVFLELNGHETVATEDDAFDHIIGVASSQIGIDDSAEWFTARIRQR